MLSREGIHDWHLYSQANMYDHAAVCAYKDRLWSHAGVQAVAALTADSSAAPRDMMVVLAKACVELDDASVVEWLHDKGMDVKELAEDLILHKEKQPAAELADSLAMLPRLYSGRELISNYAQHEQGYLLPYEARAFLVKK